MLWYVWNKYIEKKVGSRFTLLPLYLAVCLSTADKQRRSRSVEHGRDFRLPRTRPMFHVTAITESELKLKIKPSHSCGFSRELDGSAF